MAFYDSLSPVQKKKKEEVQVPYIEQSKLKFQGKRSQTTRKFKNIIFFGRNCHKLTQENTWKNWLQL